MLVKTKSNETRIQPNASCPVPTDCRDLMKLMVVPALLLDPFTLQAFAQSPFDQMGEIEAAYRQEQAAADAKKARKAEADRAREQSIDETYRRENFALDQKESTRALEITKARYKERKHLQSRDEIFEGEARAPAPEERPLDIQALKAKTTRTDEHIDAEPRAQAISTNAIQSETDAARSIFSGAKAMMESSDQAEVNKWLGN